MSEAGPVPKGRPAGVRAGTYRIQLREGFGFDDAARLAPYLAELGVSHLYTSPVLESAPGSAHGYDVVDPRRVSRERGGEEGYRRLRRALAAAGLGELLDIVPNHMAVTGPENPWWWDVLEHGASSRYAGHFDVDWDLPGSAAEESGASNAVLLPVLDTHYGRVLEAGRLRVAREGVLFRVRFEDHAFPASPRSVGGLLGDAAGRLPEAARVPPGEGGRDEEETPEEAAAELAFVARALARLPSGGPEARETAERRHRELGVLRRQLRRLLAGPHAPFLAGGVDRIVSELNRDPDRLDAFLSRQNYRLAFWTLASEELGYRRFFHINDLAALRIEDDAVFADAHVRVEDWLRTGAVDGVRVDHPDGLRDPEGYFRRLRRAAPGAWIVAEKILEGDEELPAGWGVDGTTGYEFLNRAGGLLVDPAGEAPLTRLYARFTGEPTDYRALAREKKLLAVRRLLGGDLNRLTELFRAVAARHRRHRDHTRGSLRDALAEVAASFPAYRTYVRGADGTVGEEDAARIEAAVDDARRHRPDLDPDPLDLLRDLLLLRAPGEGSRGGAEAGSPEAGLAMRFQQLTGPVMAKGVEDTALYAYNRLTSLNEVGGNPGRFGTSVEAFHRAAARAQARWPRALLAGSTHDTKRSEDVRARLHLLSEIPEGWAAAVERWAEMNVRHRTGARGGELPDRNAEYLCYQTLVGAWPIGRERLAAFMEKAAREAKLHTSWTEPDEAYEEALRRFVEGIMGSRELQADVEGFVAPLVHPGRVNSLAQTLLRIASPGVPDLYQGCELWDLSLVDPDNRRPVDFSLRRRLLRELEGLAPEAVMERMEEGLPKLWTIRQGLRLRKERPDLFGTEGGYEPLRGEGEKAAHLVAFLRGGGAVAVVPRLVLGLGGKWGDTTLELPGGAWRNRLTGDLHPGGSVAAARLLARFPVALLVREGAA